MASSTDPHGGVFHEGERAVHHRAGLEAQAARHARMLEQRVFSPGMVRFTAARSAVFLTARDGSGMLWTSPVRGLPGFCHGEASTLTVGAAPGADDPLYDLAAGQRVGALFIDFAARRRLRVNGVLTDSGPDGLRVTVEQVYGNCPQYIDREADGELPRPAATSTQRTPSLTPVHRAVLARAGTFILGTTHPLRGPDASHRGGSPGFVRLDGAELWWPDYPGNNVFNSLGNLESDSDAAMYFPGGAGLHVSGTARVLYEQPHLAPGEPAASRLVRFLPRAVVSS
ncbi:pyridoxamine 5'-phosphate oxidase family protein [Tsukamurella sputi]|uniref:pyridoxamine 5'-phosphate oxidase family protein n=1 Tax=Tsukamurella sputi TaxID=2591848 RepID=UPI0019620853|nr:pyridoxamine 5'-phosphate oxidase family protein [Tsukamurella sputi]